MEVAVLKGVNHPALREPDGERDLRFGSRCIERYLGQNDRVECTPFLLEEEGDPADGVLNGVRVRPDCNFQGDLLVGLYRRRCFYPGVWFSRFPRASPAARS